MLNFIKKYSIGIIVFLGVLIYMNLHAETISANNQIIASGISVLFIAFVAFLFSYRKNKESEVGD